MSERLHRSESWRFMALSELMYAVFTVGLFGLPLMLVVVAAVGRASPAVVVPAVLLPGVVRVCYGVMAWYRSRHGRDSPWTLARHVSGEETVSAGAWWFVLAMVPVVGFTAEIVPGTVAFLGALAVWLFIVGRLVVRLRTHLERDVRSKEVVRGRFNRLAVLMIAAGMVVGAWALWTGAIDPLMAAANAVGLTVLLLWTWTRQHRSGE